MAQTSVDWLGHSNEDECITLNVGGSRVEFYFSVGRHNFNSLVGVSLDQCRKGWSNYLVARLTSLAVEIRAGRRAKQTKEEEVNMSQDHCKTPSQEYCWTVIAPQAKNLRYDGERRWFKTIDDARTFAAQVYESVQDKNFSLAIVQVHDVVRPKPKTELISEFVGCDPNPST